MLPIPEAKRASWWSNAKAACERWPTRLGLFQALGLRGQALSSLDLKVPPLIVWAIFVAISMGVATLPSLAAFNFSFTGQSLASAFVAAVGAAIASAGVMEFRRSKTTVNPLKPDAASTVVALGVFRYSRNPMYVGMAMLLLAVVILMGSVAALACVPAFCGYITRFQIKPEERMLQQVFGAQYAAYLAQVRRWL
ncbi:methyltransferase family protein [Roseateles oligotrophus]|uniref:Isoprenylcysteine carboxylmethyltransferase family protein n=1 Tax=Roseateles oligotrophus TaxID=1769250 RepID=A0ABT2YHN5_9BURK|nr:isoprenylcysteine carboxylmethyltransferase family protein [Roseateles oligotrophus]MCV2369577.1 isoprenylcysteine carboxylmethyltransferase family protein [Roseateles oligotrophus]